jgi:tetratricopeptide (TPR) repeat protein
MSYLSRRWVGCVCLWGILLHPLLIPSVAEGKTQPSLSSHRSLPEEERGAAIPLDASGEDRAKALAAYAAGVRAETAGQISQALDHYCVAVRHDPSLVDLGVRIATEFLKQNQGSRSVEILRSLVRHHPADASLHTALALTLSVLGHPKEARNSSAAALACEPSNASAHALLFDLDSGKRSPAELTSALAALRKRAAPQPDPAEFWESVGEAYARILTERDKLSVREIAHLSLPMFEACADYAPNDIPRLMRAGDLLALDQRYAEAATLFARCLQLDPNHADIPNKLALAYLSSGKTAEAISTLETLLKSFPERSALYPALAELYGQMGEKEKARAYRAEAEKRGADPLLLGELCLREKEWTEAERLLLLAQQRPGASSAVWLRLAQLQLHQEHPQEAMAILVDAIARFPESARVALMASAVARDLRQFDTAQTHIREAEKLARLYDPELLKEDIYFEWGVLAEQSGDIAAAEQQFRQAIKLNPAHHRAMNYLSYSWADRSIRLPEALKLIQDALKLEPHNAAYLDTLGWVYFRMNQLEEALHALDTAITQGGDDAEIHEHRGDVLLKLGRRSEALAAWERAAQQDPQRKSVQLKLKPFQAPQ